MRKEQFERIQGDNQRVCKLGETAVLQKLTELGWDAFNLNSEIPNYKGADIACIHPKTHETILVQVKASADDDPSFGTGFMSDTDGNILGKNLKEDIIGPWVFVHILFENGNIVYKFYVLSKDETEALIKDSNTWYWKELTHKAKGKQPVYLPLCWITGDGLEPGKKTFRGYPRNQKVEIARLSGEEAWETKIGII